MRGGFSTAQKPNSNDSLTKNEEEEAEVSAFDLKTPGKTNGSKEVNKVITRSQKKRTKKSNANSNKRRRIE